MKKYPISSYNKHICLKANELMLLISSYLLKPYIIAVASIAYMKDRNAIINIFYPDKLIVSFEAIAAIPLLFLIYAWIRKNNNATPMVKKTWKNGKYLIETTAILQLCVTSSPLWLKSELTMTYSSWIQVSLYILIIFITPLSSYMRDCFAENKVFFTAPC